LLAALLTAPISASAAGGGPTPEVDPRVNALLAGGAPADVLIVLGQAPDLSPAESLPTKEARGRWVYETLRAEADRTQAPVIAELSRAGIPFRCFWAVNAVQARLDGPQLHRILALPGVTRIAANLPFRGVEPAQPLAASIAAPDAIEWGVNRVKAPWAWSQGYTGQGIVIAGQDTGYAWSHPALINAYRGYNAGTGTADHNYNWHDSIHSSTGVCGHDSPAPCDDHGHGTHTMGTMIGNDSAPGSAGWPTAATNPIGVAPGARWIGCRNMNGGYGTPATYIECFQWLIAPYALGRDSAHGDPARAPDVMSNSWGCPASEGCTAQNLAAIEPALNAADAAGILVVVSAGNSGPGCQTINEPPAIYPQALAVGATNSVDGLASFSSRGPVTYGGQTAIKPDLSGPGVAVRSSWPGGGYASLQGTSMAAPHVAGVAALLLSAQPALRGQTGLLKAILRLTADPIVNTTCGAAPDGVPNNSYGWGIVNAQRAIQSLGQAGALSGAVTDATGAPVTGAVTALYALGSSSTLTSTVTDDFGRYSMSVAWGSYQVAAGSSGYVTVTHSPVYVVGGFSAAQDVTLPLRPPTDLTIAAGSSASVSLSWTHAGAAVDHYEVWRGATPYFTPGDADSGPDPLATVPAPTAGGAVTYANPAPSGDPAPNYTYVVLSVSASGAKSVSSPRVGEFSFQLTP